MTTNDEIKKTEFCDLTEKPDGYTSNNRAELYERASRRAASDFVSFINEQIIRHDLQELKTLLPHGSGIDREWCFYAYPEYIRADNAFHVMDKNGHYAGFVHFSAFLQFNDGKWELQELELNEDQICMIILAYSNCLDNAPDLDNLGDYLFETIQNALEEEK